MFQRLFSLGSKKKVHVSSWASFGTGNDEQARYRPLSETSFPLESIKHRTERDRTLQTHARCIPRLFVINRWEQPTMGAEGWGP